jgi:UDPglucose 6-dehydrogenase
LVVLTEWDEFKSLDFARIYASMQKPACLFDGRNLLDLAQLRAIGFQAFGIGKGT